MSELRDINFKGDEHQGEEYQGRLSRLERYLIAQPRPSTTEVERVTSAILVSFKAGKKVATLGKRYIHKGGERCLAQSGIVVPRGALHEENVYGLKNVPIMNKNGKSSTAQKIVRKYPIETIMYKHIDQIVDKAIRNIVKDHYCKCADIDVEMWNSVDVKEWAKIEKVAWKDVQNNPLLFNDSAIKSVRRIVSPLTNAYIKTDRGYVIMGNNHHVAIYIDSDGKRIEQCVTFWSAIERRKNNIPIIIENSEDVWSNPTDGLSEEFLLTLPDPTWQFEVSLQQNEMFILGLEAEAADEALRMGDYTLLNRYLYRVQSLSPSDYWFRLHTETVNDKTPEGKLANKFYRFKSIKGFFEQHPQKVYINLLGEIKRL